MGLLMRSPERRDERRLHADLPADLHVERVRRARDAAGRLKWFVEHNPISYLASASRGLMDGNVDSHDVTVVLVTAVVLTAVFAPITGRLYRRG